MSTQFKLTALVAVLFATSLMTPALSVAASQSAGADKGHTSHHHHHHHHHKPAH